MAGIVGEPEGGEELVERHSDGFQGMTSVSSTFHHNRYDPRDYHFESTRDTISHFHRPNIPDYRSPYALTILQLLSFYKIQTFPADTHIVQNDIIPLGKGSTFRVEATTLPVWRARAHFRYRDPTFPRQGEKFYFTDHTQTKWDRNTIGAWKLLVQEVDPDKDRDRLIRDLIVELRILSHPPLQRHPNIVHVLGFVWLQDHQFFTEEQKPCTDEANELREWPTVVTQKATHGSLREFMRSDSFRTIPPSSRVKLLLCADILNGLKALHDCDIVHGDIKNWQAKIADFSHSVVLNEIESSDIDSHVSEVIRGTELYHPPEMSTTQPIRDWPSLKYVDVWNFGLLAWELMLDGTAKRPLLEDFRHRNGDTFAHQRTILLEQCEKHLRSTHPRDLMLIEVVMSLVGNCLLQDPTSRPDAASLLSYLRNKFSMPSKYDFSSPQKADKLLPLDALPFFQLSEHYYDLSATLTVPRQVCNGLESLTKAWPIGSSQSNPVLQNRLRAELQLGLCYATAFGTSADGEKAIAHITNAARHGLREARALISRAHAALGIEISSSLISEVCQWLEDAGRGGYITALQDLQDVAASNNIALDLSSRIVLAPHRAETMELLGLPSLHSAVLNRDISNILHRRDAGFDVNTRGECGEIALHYILCIPSQDGYRIAKQLLDLRADIFAETSDSIVFGTQNTILSRIDLRMSPLHLVINYDRVDLFKLFLDSCGGPNNSQLWNISTGILFLAARYASIRCLDFLCTDTDWAPYSRQHANDFDHRLFSTMYYACRPDVLDRFYRFSPFRWTFPAAEMPQAPPFAKDVRIIGLLRSVNASFQIHKENIFNALHLVASFGEPELLRYLLSEDGTSQLKDEMSEHGWTPLKDAIARGRHHCFQVLLQKNVAMKEIWSSSSGRHYHALHVCSLYPGVDVIRFAEAILDKDPQSIRARDSAKCTPLHRAAMYGRVRLIKLFLQRQADVYAINHYYRTPLGDAINARSISAIRELRQVLEERSLPEVSLRYHGFPYRVIYPVEQLLTPGNHPTTQSLRLWPYYRYGCADYPFSEPSLELLKTLLEKYPQPCKFRINFVQTALYGAVHRSGIFSAIRMANLGAIRYMFDTWKWKNANLQAFHLRHMLFQALDQLSLDEYHVADYDSRVLVAEYMWTKCVSAFDKTKAMRLEPGMMAPYWRMYYALYGDREHHQLGRAKQWIQDNPLQVYRGEMRFAHHVSTREFHRWTDLRVSPVTLTIILLVIFEVPTISYLIIIASDPLAKWQSYQTVLALWCGLLTNLLPLWTKAFRVVYIYYDSFQKVYYPLSWARLLLSIGLCTAVLAASTFNVWVLFNGSLMWIFYNKTLDPPMQSDPLKPDVVGKLYSFCSVLIAWHVVLIIPRKADSDFDDRIAAIYTLISVAFHFETGREARRNPPRTLRIDGMPGTKTVEIHRRFPSFLVI